jgi:OOP family OmpA-OmpF porin
MVVAAIGIAACSSRAPAGAPPATPSIPVAPASNDAIPDAAVVPGGVRDKEVRLQEQVRFAKGARSVDAKGREVLAEVAKLLGWNPQVRKLAVQAHASSDEARAAELSKARADAVVAELVKLKVDAERLVAESYGDTRPVADNKTEEGREKNRRVRFVVAAP